MFSEYFYLDKKQHNLLRRDLLDEEIHPLPPPPKDLPAPWNGNLWRECYVWSFIFISGIWLYCRINLTHLYSNWTLVFGYFCGIWTALGVFLFCLFFQRAFIQNRNQSHLRIVNRYKKANVPEGLFVPRVKFTIDGKDYFLYFYVPGTSGPNISNLSKGAEPLLFDSKISWVEDDALFSKSALMWAYMLEFSPQFIGNYRIYQYNMLRRKLLKQFSRLPGLLDQNKNVLVKIGMQKECTKIINVISYKSAYYRALLYKEVMMIAWGEAHGWDSSTALRYEDISVLHEGLLTFRNDIEKFYKKYNIREGEIAAQTVLQELNGNGNCGLWLKKDLIQALELFADTYNPPPEPIQKVNGQWRAPDVFQEGYHARIAWAKEVDSRIGRKV
jgi:hypothetical protein